MVEKEEGRAVIDSSYVRSLLGEWRKRIVAVNVKPEHVDLIRRAYDVKVETVRETPTTVYVRLDFPVKKSEVKVKRAGRYVVVEETIVYRRWYSGRRDTIRHVDRVVISPDAYTGERRGVEWLVDALRRLPDYNSRRLRFYALGFSHYRIPVEFRALRPDAREELVRFGLNPLVYEARVKEAGYINWWFSEKDARVRKILEVLGILDDNVRYEAHIEGQPGYVKLDVRRGGVRVKAETTWSDCESIECWDALDITYEDRYGGLVSLFNQYGIMDVRFFNDGIREKLAGDDEYTVRVARVIEAVAAAKGPEDLEL